MEANNERLKMAAYCRVSTEKEDQLMSLQGQKDFFEEYANKNNFELVELYADEGISGTKLKNRKEFNRMMLDAHRGRFTCVFVKDVSRLARNVVDFLQSIRKLKGLNIDCRFVTANMSTNDGELTLTILAAVAQEESANLSKRVKFGKKINAERGRVPNIVFGYNKKRGDYFNLEINQIEAKTVTGIFDAYVNQQDGANKIAQRLNREGIRTKRNCRWSQQAISTVLTNQLYIGKVINGKESVKDFLTGIRIKNAVSEQFVVDKPELAIIHQELFYKAQALLAKRKENFNITKQRQSNKYCFSTMIKCADCGYSFRRIQRNYVNQYIRWCCSGRNAHGVEFCNNHTMVDEAELFTAIKNYLGNLLCAKEKVLEKMVVGFTKKYKAINCQALEESLLIELEKSKKAKGKQIKMFEIDVITIQELKERTLQLNMKIDNYEKQLLSIRSKSSPIAKIDEVIRRYCSNLKEILAEDLLDNGMLRKFIDKIVVTVSGEIQVYLKLFSEFESSDIIIGE